MHQPPSRRRKPRSEFLDALRKGMLIGAGALLLALPLTWVLERQKPKAPPAELAAVQPAPAPAPRAQPPVEPPAAQLPPQPETPPLRLADFKGQGASPQAQLVANWAAHTRDAKKHAFVIIDKKQARVHVFGPDAQLIASTPVLLGKAIGDDSPPDIGTRPLHLIKEHEKTTPAGRYVARIGVNTSGEDIVWVSYDLAVSMHRLRKVKEAERRYERLMSPTIEDNRISFGCVNMPPRFFDTVLKPTVKKYGAIVYVLPDQKSLQAAIGAYDVTSRTQVAQAQAPRT